MPRRMKLDTAEMGDLYVLTYSSHDGVWEPAVAHLQGTQVGEQLSPVTRTALNHALRRLSRPLTTSLGISPEGALRKLPVAAATCHLAGTCPVRTEQCRPVAKKCPPCFEAGGYATSPERDVVSDMIREWRAGVYVLIVEEKL